MGRRAWVVVLGDVGRSPRMQYHAASLCKTVRGIGGRGAGVSGVMAQHPRSRHRLSKRASLPPPAPPPQPDFESVVLVGYPGAALVDELEAPLAAGRLRVAHLPPVPAWLARAPRQLALPLKALAQLAALLWLLLVVLPRPDVILLQLPPALPTMAVCRLAAWRHTARLVFDWHNFAYTLMALGMGARHPLVRARAGGVRGRGGGCLGLGLGLGGGHVARGRALMCCTAAAHALHQHPTNTRTVPPHPQPPPGDRCAWRRGTSGTGVALRTLRSASPHPCRPSWPPPAGASLRPCSTTAPPPPFAPPPCASGTSCCCA